MVALAKVTDLKANDSRDIVSPCVVKDLATLETKGIDLESEINLRGVLVNICCDNLGANSILGLCESFNSEFYCRICESDKTQCQKIISGHIEMLRSSAKYAKFVKEFKDTETNLKKTKGLKRCCPFNELKHFHGFENYSVDIMHDLLEGVVPLFIKIFFESLRLQNITLNKIQSLLRDFSYGFLNKGYEPSNIRFDSHNLGQSAHQLHCLILHMPFIFVNFKDDMPLDWKAMMDLVAIIQIVFSNCIKSEDLNRLNNCVNGHLSFIIGSGRNLIPKHHMLTHYSEVIKRMGPLIKMWMMRYESKHKVFTDMAHRTQNYINLPKTLANKHQMQQAFTENIYMDQIRESKTKYKIARSEHKELYRDNLDILNIANTEALSFLNYNSYEYRSGLMIFHNAECFEIIHVLKNNDTYQLYCHPFEIINFDSTLNAIEISKIQSYDKNQLIALQNQKTFERKICRNKMYVICETLDVFRHFL